ncbi:hypothetical protein [Kaistia granuli]|uniref:hypothetical protein n=1 Tax=Kaistia granuli TaxID=363259 RepID=UPI0012EB74DD|nr:hypothetical protein [Kaistia granuli]
MVTQKSANECSLAADADDLPLSQDEGGEVSGDFLSIDADFVRSREFCGKSATGPDDPTFAISIPAAASAGKACSGLS